MKQYLRKLRTLVAVWSLLTLVVGQAGFTSLPTATMGFGQKAQAQELVLEGDQLVELASPPKVVICHATGTPNNPYNRLVVSSKAEAGHFDENGTPLEGHEDDLLIENNEDAQ